MVNRVILVGRLVHDPELRRTANELAVSSFRIAVDGRFKNSPSVFLEVKVWSSQNGQQAENVAKYCRKGSLVSVDGYLSQRVWERKDGSKVTVTEVVADSVKFLDTKGKAGNEVAAESVEDAVAEETPVETSKNTDSIDVVDEDLPW